MHTSSSKLFPGLAVILAIFLSSAKFAHGLSINQQNHPGYAARELDSLGNGNILRDVSEPNNDRQDRQLDTIGNGNILRSLDSLGGGNILRSLRYFHVPQRYSPGKRNFDEIDSHGFGSRFVKRNFDEIDDAAFGRFVKRNFDEIDSHGFGSRFVKRAFDEIDRSGGFGSRFV